MVGSLGDHVSLRLIPKLGSVPTCLLVQPVSSVLSLGSKEAVTVVESMVWLKEKPSTGKGILRAFGANRGRRDVDSLISSWLEALPFGSGNWDSRYRYVG